MLKKKYSCYTYCVVLLVFLLNSVKAQMLYIMPFEQEVALRELIQSISRAKSSIQIAIYSFTNREIARALRDASSRGVKIDIIYDMGQKDIPNSTIGYLEKYEHIHTCLLEGLKAKNGKYKGIMHQKMIIVDDSLLGLGSANWSKNAFENSYETLFFTEDVDMVKKAKSYYTKMLGECEPFMKY